MALTSNGCYAFDKFCIVYPPPGLKPVACYSSRRLKLRDVRVRIVFCQLISTSTFQCLVKLMNSLLQHHTLLSLCEHSNLQAIRCFVSCINTLEFLTSRLPEDIDVGDGDVACLWLLGCIHSVFLLIHISPRPSCFRPVRFGSSLSMFIKGL